MNTFTFDADTLIEALAALTALACLLLGLRFATRRQFFAAAVLLIPAGLALAVFIFFLTFRIRLM